MSPCTSQNVQCHRSLFVAPLRLSVRSHHSDLITIINQDLDVEEATPIVTSNSRST